MAGIAPELYGPVGLDGDFRVVVADKFMILAFILALIA